MRTGGGAKKGSRDEHRRKSRLESRTLRLVGSDPADAIAAYAQELKPDVLAMGSIGFGAHRFSAFGSVAARVATRTTGSLLLVREQ